MDYVTFSSVLLRSTVSDQRGAQPYCVLPWAVWPDGYDTLTGAV